MNWQPIETAPRDGTLILALCAGIVCTIAYRHDTEPVYQDIIVWWWPFRKVRSVEVRREKVEYWSIVSLYRKANGRIAWGWDVSPNIDPSHWMPLPPAPSQGDQP